MGKSNWRSFEEARAFVHQLQLKNQKEWRDWTKISAKPDDIPAAPDRTYKNVGWQDFGDWLGTDKVANQNRIYISYEEARAFVHKLQLKNQKQWRNWAKTTAKPDDIPADPTLVYKDSGWIGFGDWLGTGTIAPFNRDYRPFEEARAFVHQLKLKNGKEWREWAKSKAKPDDIPAAPAHVYKDEGWGSLGDWLGSGTIAVFNRDYRPFEDARIYVRQLKLKSRKVWEVWIKKDEIPDNIPAAPSHFYKDEGWNGWGDWLGTGTIAPFNRVFRPFEEACTFTHKLQLKSKDEWASWAKSEAKPDDIPADPEGVYKSKGWSGWGNWLGTGTIASYNRIYRPFEEARAFARILLLKGREEWIVWAKNGEKPDDIPTNPPQTYKDKGWLGWGDWLGTDSIANQNRVFLPFDDARAFVHKLQLKNQKQWREWVKNDKIPDYIPANPARTYKDKGWNGFGDWLGTGTIAPQNRVYLSYEEARDVVHKLQIRSGEEWSNSIKNGQIPENIPANPERVYKSKGWSGWGDWLGIINRWTQNVILNFLYSLKPVLSNLEPSELYSILRQNGMIASISNGRKDTELLKSIKDLCSSNNLDSDYNSLITHVEEELGKGNNKSDEIEFDNLLIEENLNNDEEVATDLVPNEIEAIDTELPQLKSFDSLKAVDLLVEAGITSDHETIEFLICNRVSALWQACLNNDLSFDLERLRNETGGTYFQTIRDRFLSQYDGAANLTIPNGYNFPYPPNLMQRLTAYRILTERRIGNWSGVGAGKTISAIFASRVINAKFTIVIAFNSTIEGWAKAIAQVYPDSIIYQKERGEISVDRNQHNYLILNFEKFQQPYSAELVGNILNHHQIDFVVIDEIQNVKQRDPNPNKESKRRKTLNYLLSEASRQNPELCVLGMSATPVINNLYEAKALLEMTRGEEFDELKTFSTIANALAMHEKLMLHGIRYRPNYKIAIAESFPEISGEHLRPQLIAAIKTSPLAVEQILLSAKIDTIIAHLQTGTLIYTHYVDGMVEPLRKAIAAAGYKVGLYTGVQETEERNSAKEKFIAREIDILIGTAPIGTGVDGLQYVCDRLIIASLPWTHAEYEQLVGRIYRQKSSFDKVEVIIPQVILDHQGDIWSWDRQYRWSRIQWKKSLADTAIDGVIPKGELASEKVVLKKAGEALQTWIDRVESGDIYEINREELRVPLPEAIAKILQRRFGDFSAMNNRFNNSYSQTTGDRLKANPEEWYQYHTLYRAAREKWNEIPYEKIAEKLQNYNNLQIGDFGCGEAKLAELLPNHQVHSFDHIAINAKVQACDISHTPLPDATLDVAIFSLSLMGLNYADYLQEAHRTLKGGGSLLIAETISRWTDKKQELLDLIASFGFTVVKEQEGDRFLYINATKPLISLM
ncbi:methyltransferase domain-containing protein [Pseudanabaena sp. UWO311]|uniref:helicase-related protein n=1 Tax=Pseudanabaena sp. UWO311 TaxID=2487337 RepID=UPI00115B6AED|nr:helicase-related protein [Pseudanabaena sp. UWO311]TYQ26379.1 methyltransferase domain-containing protein [Pseudanabaena sp. UWO311]